VLHFLSQVGTPIARFTILVFYIICGTVFQSISPLFLQNLFKIVTGKFFFRRMFHEMPSIWLLFSAHADVEFTCISFVDYA